jgi:hypothetical protein
MKKPQTAFSAVDFNTNESARAARAAHARMMREGVTELYVYFRPYWLAAFAAGDEIPEGWTLAWAERVPSSLTADQLVQWFAARSGRVPYLIDG